jgi:hypothetical protein
MTNARPRGLRIWYSTLKNVNPPPDETFKHLFF